MVPVLSLWLPILVAAVLVFVASSIIHMLLPYHRTDFSKLPAEVEVMETLRRVGVTSGDYVMPHAATPKEMSDPAYVERSKEGPVAMLSVGRSGPPAMGRQLATWFVYCLVVSFSAAYLAGRALAPGEEFKEVFRFAGTVAFVGYALALWQESIWGYRKVSTVLKNTLDGGIYAALTGLAFAWLWPGA